MKKLFLTLFLPLILVAFKWDFSHNFVLTKDAVGKIEVKKKQDASVRVVTLRWTLYQNERLVLLIKYDGFPTQYILQKKYKRDSIKIALRDDYHERSKRSYLILSFKDFNAKNRSALLKAFVTDPQKSLEIKFTDPKTRKG